MINGCKARLALTYPRIWEISVTASTATPIMDDPQFTSKVVPFNVKQALLVELGFVRDALCTTCDLLLITKSGFSASLGNISSSEEDLESVSDEDDESWSSCGRVDRLNVTRFIPLSILLSRLVRTFVRAVGQLQ